MYCSDTLCIFSMYRSDATLYVFSACIVQILSAFLVCIVQILSVFSACIVQTLSVFSACIVQILSVFQYVSFRYSLYSQHVLFRYSLYSSICTHSDTLSILSVFRTNTTCSRTQFSTVILCLYQSRYDSISL